MNSIRVRFAPSPTGPLHIGGLRTALYNYFFARHHGGSFILRIEDTDQSRHVEGAEEYMLNSLEWCGIVPDEGPGFGGKFGPYRQSQRLETYRKYATLLVDGGYAYYAFDTSEELMRARNEGSGKTGTHFQYSSETRGGMRNSLTMTSEEVDSLIAQKVPFVLRIKIPENEIISVTDSIRGQVSVSSKELDDKVILKSDGMPTYHLANVVDDHLMKVSHVIRGEEWLPSTPLHALLYRFFGWETDMPQFAHLPLLLKPDGKGKLSKRDGAKHGYPVFPMDWTDEISGENYKGFKELGFMPEAMVNFLALLGWNPGTDKEIFSMDELFRSFTLDHVHKGGAKFDIEKAKWLNQQYLMKAPTSKLSSILAEHLKKEGIDASDQKIEGVVEAMRERIVVPGDLWDNGRFFFIQPSRYDENVISKRWTPDNVKVLKDYAVALSRLSEIDEKEAKETLDVILAFYDMAVGQVMQLLRVVVTGETRGPGLMKIITILGPKETSCRISNAVDSISEETSQE